MRQWLARELAKNDKSLVGFWPLIENGLDYSGGRNHLTMNSSIAHSYRGHRGCYLNCKTGTVTNGLTTTSSVPFQFRLKQPFSVSCWFRRDISSTNGGPLVSIWDNGSSNGWVSTVKDNVSEAYLHFRDGNVNGTISYQWEVKGVFEPNSVIVYNKWYHILFTYDGSGVPIGVKLYVNGVRIDTSITLNNSSTSGSYTPSTFLSIGGLGYNFLPSLTNAQPLSTARVWRRVISQVEAKKLYESEARITADREIVGFVQPTSGSPNSHIPLFIDGLDVDNSNTTLYTIGGTGIASSHIPLYTIATDFGSGHIPLYTLGGTGITNNHIPLYVHGMDTSSKSTTLFESASAGNDHHSMNLFCKGPVPFTNNNHVPLTVYGAAAGRTELFRGLTLFTGGKPLSEAMNLFACAPLSDSYHNKLNLSVYGQGFPANGFLDLVLYNDVNWNTLPFYVQGHGVTDGAIPYAKGMNLFINRLTNSGLPLVVQGPQNVFNDSMSMYVYGALGMNKNCNLAIPKVKGLENETLALYSHGF